jgi:hypothetical protein
VRFFARGPQRYGNEDAKLDAPRGRRDAISDYTKEGGIAMISTNYFHAIDGRIRIHISEVKGAAVKAREAEAKLMGYVGIISVSANPTSGNVLISYDSRRISQGDVFQDLWDLGYLREGKLTASSVQIKRSDHPEWGETIARFALEALFLPLTG